MTTSSHSFVVLAYGESPYVEECIQSLLRQTRQGKVLLTTSTPSPYLTDISSRLGLALIVNPEAGGIAADWSFALASADTRYVTLAHQDDLYDSTYVEHCVEAAARHPDNLITFTRYREMRGDKITHYNLNLVVKSLMLKLAFGWRECARTPRQKRRVVAFGSPIPCPSVMYNRDALGHFAFSPGYEVNLDWDAWIRLVERPGSFVLVREKLMTHRIHSASQTTEGILNSRRRQEDLRCFERLWPRAIARALAVAYSLSYRSNR
ncbi:MAG: glycosyltransferase family 2 protein [Acidobacteriota bacterium]